MPSIHRKSHRSKRLLNKLLSLLLCVLLPAGMMPAALATNVGTSLTVGIQSYKTTQLFPLDPQERDMVSVYGMIYESLIVIDDNYEPSSGIATSW